MRWSFHPGLNAMPRKFSDRLCSETHPAGVQIQLEHQKLLSGLVSRCADNVPSAAAAAALLSRISQLACCTKKEISSVKRAKGLWQSEQYFTFVCTARVEYSCHFGTEAPHAF